ncbi:NTP transferase domain-containing protein [Herbiconiux sp. CPCC 203407]|uniref:NTP transferase domain-containing protein n=1 Tax=Herbiconiux oxytropis TaxID=2970915 RepID=A0AA41XJD6_9MICO|nr:NTP transferase domain-containing protein [Herbiconiux oxytropis]MCS5722378.1 NTP transferase domain-containing protein [Herbiconiux oxytropis]MCS5727225.1 NTP transferase domain-containing protein [Herbiconiux oxytropis]
MLLDAIVLAGGRSSRLGGSPKAELLVRGRRLVDIAVEAVLTAGSRHVVVVGPDELAPLPAAATLTREDPPFGGPAAALAAGLAGLADLAADVSTPPDALLVLACDMPGAERALPALLDAVLSESSGTPRAGGGSGEGWAVMAVDHDGRRQPLLAVYGLAALSARVSVRSSEPGGLDGAPFHSLLEGLGITEVPIPAGSSSDIDTWSDAGRFHAHPRSAQEHR